MKTNFNLKQNGNDGKVFFILGYFLEEFYIFLELNTVFMDVVLKCYLKLRKKNPYGTVKISWFVYSVVRISLTDYHELSGNKHTSTCVFFVLRFDVDKGQMRQFLHLAIKSPSFYIVANLMHPKLLGIKECEKRTLNGCGACFANKPGILLFDR